MLGRRGYLRVKVKSRVRWSIEGHTLSGEAIVINHSISGIKFILDKTFEFPQDAILLIEPLSVSQFTGVKKIKIKWVKNVQENGKDILEVGGDLMQ